MPLQEITASRDCKSAESPRFKRPRVARDHPVTGRSSPSPQPQFSTARAAQPANSVHRTLYSHFGNRHEIYLCMSL